MSQEDKNLLLTDLSARLPYGVKVYAGEDIAMTLRQIDYKGFCESWENEDFKCHSRWMLPYLRPMSSMTEEEKEELLLLMKEETKEMIELMRNDNFGVLKGKYHFNCLKELNWLLKNHFDFNGLIPKGLAIEVTKENNPYEN